MQGVTAERPDVQVLTVAYDDDLDEATAIHDAQGARWPTFVIDPNGVVTEVFNGTATTEALVAAIG